MRSETHPPRAGYRVAGDPRALRLIVTTVRRGEYAAPLWLAKLAGAWKRFRDAMREALDDPLRAMPRSVIEGRC